MNLLCTFLVIWVLDLLCVKLHILKASIISFQSPGRPQSVILTNVPSRAAPMPPPRPDSTQQTVSSSLPTSTSAPSLAGATAAPAPPPLPARNRVSQANMIMTEDGDPETPPPLPPPRQTMPLPAPPLAERRAHPQSPRRSQTTAGMVGHVFILNSGHSL